MGKRTFTGLVFMLLSGFWPAPPAGADVHDYGDPAADLRTAYERAIGGAVPADGLMGPETRDAIRDFQRRHGLEADGEITGGLIDALADALASTPRAAPALPANAHRIPFLSDWTCDRGYLRKGDRCEKVAVPLNARPWRDVLGDGWVCNRGHRRVGDRCDRAPIPRNATRDRHGVGWSCNRGYRQAGNWCVRQSIPRRTNTCCGLRPRP